MRLPWTKNEKVEKNYFLVKGVFFQDCLVIETDKNEN